MRMPPPSPPPPRLSVVSGVSSSTEEGVAAALLCNWSLAHCEEVAMASVNRNNGNTMKIVAFGIAAVASKFCYID